MTQNGQKMLLDLFKSLWYPNMVSTVWKNTHSGQN